jgi:hypothetical protein
VSAWQSVCLAFMVSTALTVEAVPQAAANDRDIPTGDVWGSREQRYPSPVMRPIPSRDPAPSGDVWLFPEAGSETTGSGLLEPRDHNDPGHASAPGGKARN